MPGHRLIALVGMVLLTGCASLREAAPGPGVPAVPRDMPASIRYLPPEAGEPAAHAVAFWRRLGDRGQSVNLLAISGGGADGAFAAGALVGLGHRQRRPVYDVVTGVSTGALLAPFAFLGPDWDAQLQSLFSVDSGRSLLRLNWSGRSALYSASPLQALIDRTYNDSLIDAVARAGAQGRTLLVATTNLDDESPVIWDLTAIAALGTAPARALFRQVLLASASYPALLPPVMIRVESPEGPHQEMHVDGGATLPFFIGPGTDSLAPEAVGALSRVHAYVLINRQLNAASRTVSPQLVPVLRRALSTQSRLATRTAVLAADEFARRHSMALEVADIFQAQVTPRPFDFGDPAVQTLFESAQQRALNGTLWQGAAEVLNHILPKNFNAAF